MITELFRFKTDERGCPYIPTEMASMEYRVILDVSAEGFEMMLTQGWRRFGAQYFRPACRACSKCKDLRVVVSEFKRSKSQARTWRRNNGIQLVVQQPTLSAEHVRLYNEYHAFMSSLRGWPIQSITEAEYEEGFLLGSPYFAREFLYFEGKRLVAVGLVDVLPNSISSGYFFHDPGMRERALGVYSVLKELEFAAEQGLEYLYMGFWVKECGSMAYKAQYRPNEILEGFPGDGEEGVWKRRLMANG